MNSKALAILLAVLPITALPAPVSAKSGDVIPNSYICVFNRAVNRAGVEGEANRMASGNGGQATRFFRYAVRGFAVNMSMQGVAQMRARNPSIAYCEPDRVMELSPIEANAKPGGGGGSTGQQTPWGVARVGHASGVGKTAWIIDTGIADHPDLTIDRSRGDGFVTREEHVTDDLNGHGTHVSGTIAARDNSIGVIGVAAGATVVPVRVLDRRGSGSYSGVIAGVDFVAAHGAVGDVANMSLGGPPDDALDGAVKAAAALGIRFAIAAGNSADNANNYSPARAGSDPAAGNVYVVSAFAQGNTWASFSNYGNPPVDYSEPGVNITSTWKGGGYNTISGTSMATPHLAGLLLIGFSADGNVSGDPDGNPDPIGAHK